MSKDEKILFGVRPVEELLESNLSIKKVWFEKGKTENKFKELSDLCKKNNISFGEKSGKFLEKLSKTFKHQGVIAIYTPETNELCFEKKQNSPRYGNYLCLYLDRIQDPQNFGAIVRSAEFFGADQIFYPEHHGAPFNSTAQKTSSGAGIHNPPYKLTSISNFFEKIKENGFNIIGSSPNEGKLINEIDFAKDTLLIIGSEGEGMSDKVHKYCDEFIKIPQLGKISSLNASVSAGILLYHIQVIKKYQTTF